MTDRDGSENADALSLDHMRAFIAVIETGSQVRAAKQLRIAQTTVCRHIERVQDHFGGQLFEAGSSGALSTRGLVVEQAVRSAMAELGRARERVATERPVLRIGFIRAVRPLVEQALRDQHRTQRRPAFDVRLSELTSEAQARALQRRELDIALCYALPVLTARDGIEASVIGEEPYALVIPERAWVKGRISVSALSRLHYVHPPRRFANAVVTAGEGWLKAQGLTPERVIECPLGSEIFAYAASGYGYGFLPALWRMASHEGVVFAPVPSLGVSAEIAAYSLRHVTPHITRLRQDLCNAARAVLKDFHAS
jgi:DNA-binding transcriptional LysR family regulator